MSLVWYNGVAEKPNNHRGIYAMSIVSQNRENETDILDCIQRFFSKYKIGSLLKRCNGTKEKGVPAISLLRYKLGNIFVGRSILQC